VLYLYPAYDPNLQQFVNRDPISEFGGVNLYRFVRNNPINAIDQLGLVDVGKIAGGGLQVIGGVLAAVAISVAEAPSLGAATVAVPTVFFGISHGLVQIGAGIKDDPSDEALNSFLEHYPKNPGEALVVPWGPAVMKPVGLVWDVGSLGLSEFGLFNDFVEGERLALPWAAFGTEFGKAVESGVEVAAPLWNAYFNEKCPPAGQGGNSAPFVPLSPNNSLSPVIVPPTWNNHH